MNNIITPKIAKSHINMQSEYGEKMIYDGLYDIYSKCIELNMNFNIESRKFIDNKGKKYPEYRFIKPFYYISSNWKYKFQLLYYNIFNN